MFSAETNILSKGTGRIGALLMFTTAEPLSLTSVK